MSSVAASPRSIAWHRRRRSLAQAWAQYRRHLPGMIGLGVLVAIVAMALLAPVISNPDELHVVNTLDNPRWATPSEFPPLGHRQLRA